MFLYTTYMWLVKQRVEGAVWSVPGCKRKEDMGSDTMPSPKKPRLVFTDLQRRTLQAIFKVSTTDIYNLQ